MLRCSTTASWRKPSTRASWAYLILHLYRTTTNQYRSTLLPMTPSPWRSGSWNLSRRRTCHIPRESTTTDCPGGDELWKTRSGFSLIAFGVYSPRCCSLQRQWRPLCCLASAYTIFWDCATEMSMWVSLTRKTTITTSYQENGERTTLSWMGWWSCLPTQLRREQRTNGNIFGPTSAQ